MVSSVSAVQCLEFVLTRCPHCQKSSSSPRQSLRKADDNFLSLFRLTRVFAAVSTRPSPNAPRPNSKRLALVLLTPKAARARLSLFSVKSLKLSSVDRWARTLLFPSTRLARMSLPMPTRLPSLIRSSRAASSLTRLTLSTTNTSQPFRSSRTLSKCTAKSRSAMLVSDYDFDSSQKGSPDLLRHHSRFQALRARR